MKIGTYLGFVLLVMLIFGQVKGQQTAEDWADKGLITLALGGSWDEALNDFEEAIRLDPKCVMAWLNKGSTLASTGRYEEAIKAFDEAIRLDPEEELAWRNKGIALEALSEGKSDKEKEALKAEAQRDYEIADEIIKKQKSAGKQENATEK